MSSVKPADHPEFPSAITREDFVRNLAAVRSRIDRAAERVGRSGYEVRLLPVSKTVDEARLRLAIQAGCRMLGENKVQEAKRKWQNLADCDVQWSIIGHLQSNKARDVALFASEFQALDSLRVAELLDRRLQSLGRGLDVFVQVNTSGEESKFGLEPDRVLEFLEQVRHLDSLRVQGLMTLAVFSTDDERVRTCFRLLRDLRDRARDLDPDLVGPGGLSMGMSGDFESGIEEGATVVRVGQAIFGARPTPDSDYWPVSS